ncbi:chlorophyllase type 0 [Beta vulgaris subsp. vulgaris]|uniref:chlorophyllase type 0 n=1 Tax=Beta vulgaris subsp. vulgaris TaxID=3555 RepID=UPI0020366F71|nr:chlorophyllase type 0 [Beta vulgaris subsp. vulgaris]
MGSLWVSISVIMILMLTILDYSEAEFSTTTPSFLLESISQYDNSHVSEKLTVFETGKYQVTNPILVRKSQYSTPEPLLIVSPKEAGSYPILFFIHGTLISNQDYSHLFKHVASHGFIVVAPLLFPPLVIFPPSQADEIEMAASMINWLPSKLHEVLRDHVNAKVSADLQKVAISGHSRGGKSAFALALGMSKTKLNFNISALIGVDPVAGPDNHSQTEPHVLTYIDNSFDLSIPCTVIGTGLGSKRNRLIPPCAPSNVSHQQFFNELKQGSHFVIEKYGHMQMLNDFLTDPVAVSMSVMCTSGFGPKTTMRRTLGGIMVAFLDAYFRDEKQQFFTLMANPSLAPTKLSVEKKGKFRFAPTNAQQL